jgi:hypothetical protein
MSADTLERCLQILLEWSAAHSEGTNINTKIQLARARLDDSTAMDVLLAPIPNGDQLRQRLLTRTSGRTQGYHEETRTARYVVSDGQLVLCFTVTDLTIEQAATIATKCDAITEWEYGAFQAVVERVMGSSFGLVQ